MEDIRLIKNLVSEKLHSISPYTAESISVFSFERHFKINYFDFLNQLIFELYYDYYIKHSKRVTLAELFREAFADNNEEKSVYYSSNPDYQRLYKYYKKFRVSNDNKAIEAYKSSGINESQYRESDNIQYKQLVSPREKSKGHSLREYQKFQLLKILDYDIFERILNGTIADSGDLKEDELISKLEKFEDIYKEIQDEFESHFERSVQYYQLEMSCRVELYYSIAYFISNKKGSRSVEAKRNAIDKLMYLVGIRSRGVLYQNKFVLNSLIHMKKYIDKGDLYPEEELDDVILKTLGLCQLKKRLKDEIEFELKKLEFDFDYTREEQFFKNFLGEGQHIQNKSWNKIKMKNFRDCFL